LCQYGYKCGVIVTIYELKKQGKLSDFADVASDNPFEFGRGTIIAVGESRKFDKTGKRQHKRKVKQDLSHIKEEDVRREVAKGSKLISH